MRQDKLTFTELPHEYHWDGVLVPSITRILRKYVAITLYGEMYLVNTVTGSCIPQAAMATASKKGSAIHKGCAVMLNGGIEWTSLHPALEPPLRQFEQWITDHTIKEVVLSEEPLFSIRYLYAGRPDFLVRISRGKKDVLTLVEVKTGDEGPVGPQTAAQEELIRGAKVVTRGVIERYLLKLPQDGSPYTFRPLTNTTDLPYFLHRRALYDYDKENL